MKYQERDETVILAGLKSKLNKDSYLPEVKIRFTKGKYLPDIQFTSPAEVVKFLRSIYGNDIETREIFLVIYCDQANKPIAYSKYFYGGTAATFVDANMIQTTAIKLLMTKGIIISHNHPSGNTNPSKPDMDITNTILKRMEAIGMRLLDHIIVTKNDYTSLADEGTLGNLNYNNMKITRQNLSKEYPAITVQLPQTHNQENYDEILQMLEVYDDAAESAPEIVEYVDKWLNKLNDIVENNAIQPAKQRSKPKPKARSFSSKKNKPAKQVKPKSKKQEPQKRSSKKQPKTPKTPKAPKPAKVDNTKYVENIDTEITLIKRYANLHNKTKSLKEVSSLLVAIKKAALKKQIRANSIFKDEIDNMVNRLEKLVETMKSNKAGGVKIEVTNYEKYREIGNSQKLMKCVAIILKYLNMIGKVNIDTKVNNLLSVIKQAREKGQVCSTYAPMIEFVEKNLKLYEAKQELLEIPETELRGFGLAAPSFIAGLIGGIFSNMIASKISSPAQKKIVSANEMSKMQFETLDLPSEYKQMIGNPMRGGSIMIYGEPGSGKSSLAIKMAKSFADRGKKVLYITKEEGVNATMQEKLNRYKATSPNLFITEDIPNDMTGYDMVVFDSVQTLRMQPADIENHKKYKNDIRLYVFQVTKEGKFRGEEEYAHLVDCVLYADNGEITSFGHKNRFGGRGTMKVY